MSLGPLGEPRLAGQVDAIEILRLCERCEVLSLGFQRWLYGEVMRAYGEAQFTAVHYVGELR